MSERRSERYSVSREVKGERVRERKRERERTREREKDIYIYIYIYMNETMCLQ